jgi:flagellar hook-length control protein FliK
MPQGEVASANAAPVAPNTANNDAAANFDQLVATALRAAPPREQRKANTSDVSAPATPTKPTAPAAAPVPATPQAPTANAPSVPAHAATPAAAATSAAAPAVPNTNVDGAVVATDEEAEAASLAALVKRPAAPRNAEPRAGASTPITVNAIPEPSLSDAEPIETPAPRSGAGALTAATGLAAQVKGQELQNTPQQPIDPRVAASPEKAAAESAATTAATLDTDSSVERETANTPSTARTSEGQALPPAHDSAVRSTSFTDALNAARGSRASANPLVAQVVVQVTKAVSEGNDRITIKLSPADLGRIDVRLDIGSDGKIHAVFAADKPQTVEMLQRDARELERSLQDAGLRADSGSLSFNLRGEQRDANGSAFAGGTSHTGSVDALADVPVAATQIYSGTNAASGRLDIHV